MSQDTTATVNVQHLVRAGVDALAKGQFTQAYEALRSALAQSPNDLAALSQMGRLCVTIGRAEEARVALELALQQRPDVAVNWFLLGMAFQYLNSFQRAHECFDKALTLKPGDEIIVAMKATLHYVCGEHEAGMQVIEPYLARSPQHAAVVSIFGRLARHVGRSDEALASIQACVPNADRGNAVNLYFAMADLLDRAGRYEEAMDAWNRANAAKGSTYDAAKFEEAVDRTIQAWSIDRVRAMPKPKRLSDRPVFVVGMPRSGTTLVEQILGSHPQAHGAGELAAVPRMVRDHTRFAPAGVPLVVDPDAFTADVIDRHASEYLQVIDSLAPNASRVIDKMPINFSCLGYIQTILPQARVIHIQRDPMDTCLSCYMQHFTGFMPFTYDLKHLGHFYQQYLRLMEHWRTVLTIPMLEITYEGIVRQTEAESRRLVEFIGLPWDDVCLRFYERGNLALTASFDQVRRPIYDSSLYRHRRYGNLLDPLRNALGAAAPPA